MSRLISVAILGILLTACAHDPYSFGWDSGVSAKQPNYIPVPQGMALQDRYHESHTRTVGNYQYADLEYKGDVPVAEVSSYVLERFNTERFALKNRKSLSTHREEMMFQRGRLTVACDVERLEDITRLRYEVRTQVRSEPATPADTKAAPAKK